MTAILSGKAVGGPRAGAKLEAPFTWDGRVRKQNKDPRIAPTSVAPSAFYPGQYTWDTDTQQWVWKPTK